MGSGPTVVVKRGDIQGHTPPPGGDFARRSLVPRALAPLTSRVLGIHCVDTTERVLALTYDDGPHPEHTPRLLDALAARGARATFFVLAGPATRHPDLIRRIVDEGHELALHGADHRSLLTMKPRAAVEAIARAREAVEAVSGTRLRLLRPPYGHHTPLQAWLLHRAGWRLVIWSSDGLDWIDDAPEHIVDRAWRAVFPGAILLLHDDRADPETLRAGEALPAFDKAAVATSLLDLAAHEGYRTLTVSELLEERSPVLSGSRERMLRR
jgi:peptidoglycan-N-acetylglucosamine deacetylase